MANKLFLTHDQLLTLVPKWKMSFDWGCVQGDTHYEKREALLVKIHETTNVVIAGGITGYFWIVVPPALLACIEGGTDFTPATGDEHLPMGTNEIINVGLLKRRWRVYVDTGLPPNRIMLGANATDLGGCVDISNFPENES